jgi:hypothetical protein
MDIQFDEYCGFLFDYDDVFRGEFLPNRNALVCQRRQGCDTSFCILFGRLCSRFRNLFLFQLQKILDEKEVVSFGNLK